MPLFATNKTSLLYRPWQRAFVVPFFFVTLAALLFWLDTFRVYQAEVRVLVIAKSPSVLTEQMVENFTELSKNLSFAERVLADNERLQDDFAPYSQDERKTLWHKIVTVRQSGDSSVLVVTARQESTEAATNLSRETVKALFSVAGLYYNIKTDIDLRVVDEPIVKPVISDPLWYVLSSIGSAFALTTLFFLILSLLPFFFTGHRGKVSSRNTPLPQPLATHKKAYLEFSFGESPALHGMIQRIALQDERGQTYADQ